MTSISDTKKDLARVKYVVDQSESTEQSSSHDHDTAAQMRGVLICCDAIVEAKIVSAYRA
jgi:hypothetical protein